jgi:hypothetical protein
VQRNPFSKHLLDAQPTAYKAHFMSQKGHVRLKKRAHFGVFQKVGEGAQGPVPPPSGSAAFDFYVIQLRS